MTRDEMLRQIENILEKEPNSLTGAEKMSEIGAVDSIAILSFISAADKSCGVRLKAEQILGCNTIGDLLALLKL
jgi:acyl carrier protein